MAEIKKTRRRVSQWLQNYLTAEITKLLDGRDYKSTWQQRSQNYLTAEITKLLDSKDFKTTWRQRLQNYVTAEITKLRDSSDKNYATEEIT